MLDVTRLTYVELHGLLGNTSGEQIQGGTPAWQYSSELAGCRSLSSCEQASSASMSSLVDPIGCDADSVTS